MPKTIYKPGQTVPRSGQYGAVLATGRWAGREVTCVKGERFPPTRSNEVGYVMRDVTIHRGY